MKHSTARIAMIMAAIAAPAAANAAIMTSPDGLVAGDYSTMVEARSRLDAGNSQTWKTALIAPGFNLLDTGGNTTPANNPWQDNVSAAFSLDYSADTGLTTLTVDWGTRTETTSATVLPDAANSFVGFGFIARSEADSSSTLDNLSLKLNGIDEFLPITSHSAIGRDYTTADFFFSNADDIDSFRLTGNITFDWSPTANIKGERFRVATNLYQGESIPSPTPAALACIALAATIRRRS